MAKTEPAKRKLKFNDYGELLTEVNSLLENGYTRHANWTLGQTCGHLADWMRFPMDGYPKIPLLMRPIIWVMKLTVVPGMKKKILTEGMQGGMPTAPETVPKSEELSDQQGVAKLQAVVERIERYNGELQPSPLFGPMDRETWQKVNLIHAEHHLGYLEPNS